jgi:hypothetical protein
VTISPEDFYKQSCENKKPPTWIPTGNGVLFVGSSGSLLNSGEEATAVEPDTVSEEEIPEERGIESEPGAPINPAPLAKLKSAGSSCTCL